MFSENLKKIGHKLNKKEKELSKFIKENLVNEIDIENNFVVLFHNVLHKNQFKNDKELLVFALCDVLVKRFKTLKYDFKFTLEIGTPEEFNLDVDYKDHDKNDFISYRITILKK